MNEAELEDDEDDETGSFRRIDYRIRPAKQIERRLIAEALQQLLRSQSNSSDYTYVGMGSIAFVDFAMIHRALGLSKMVSIERERFAERANFNRPYRCIRVESGDVNTVLPNLDFGPRSIVWLDYDKKLQEKMFADLSVCATKAGIGSVILLTINAESGKNPKGELEKIRRRIGPNRLPDEISAKAFAGKAYAEFLRGVFASELQARLSQFNKGRPNKEKRVAKQFLYFLYQDGAKMCTFGWILDSIEPPKIVEKTGLKNLSVFRDADVPFEIAPPVITPAEARELNRQMPCEVGLLAECAGLNPPEIEAYATLYRHFPLYFEIAEA